MALLRLLHHALVSVKALVDRLDIRDLGKFVILLEFLGTTQVNVESSAVRLRIEKVTSILQMLHLANISNRSLIPTKAVRTINPDPTAGKPTVVPILDLEGVISTMAQIADFQVPGLHHITTTSPTVAEGVTSTMPSGPHPHLVVVGNTKVRAFIIMARGLPQLDLHLQVDRTHPTRQIMRTISGLLTGALKEETTEGNS